MKTAFDNSSSLGGDSKRIKIHSEACRDVVYRNHAHTQLAGVFLNHASYFNHNRQTRNVLTNLVDTMESGKDILIKQLLCPVPAELCNGKELSLANGGVSLEHLSEEERRHHPTLLADDVLFENFEEQIVTINCRDLCTVSEKTGRCNKCFPEEASALLAGYLVLGELAANLRAPISYVSLAGTKSGIAQLIAPGLVSSGYFKFVFGNGYHLSLTAYAAPKCFNNSYLKQVRTKLCICFLQIAS
jgi:hypothetical protein